MLLLYHVSVAKHKIEWYMYDLTVFCLSKSLSTIRVVSVNGIDAIVRHPSNHGLDREPGFEMGQTHDDLYHSLSLILLLTLEEKRTGYYSSSVACFAAIFVHGGIEVVHMT